MFDVEITLSYLRHPNEPNVLMVPPLKLNEAGVRRELVPETRKLKPTSTNLLVPGRTFNLTCEKQ